MTLSILELAKQLNAEVFGGDASLPISSTADIMSAQQGQVTVFTDKRYAKYLTDSNASACLVASDFSSNDIPEGLCLLKCDDPEISFINAINILHPARNYDKSISPEASVAGDVSLGKDIHVGAFAYIGNGSQIADGCDILPGAYIGNNVKIGKNCQVYPYAVIYDNCVIGNNVIIHSGSIIGADGFGYKCRKGIHIKVPQVGNVVIEDNVEIGANTCIDRGAQGETFIGSGSKIDNLVQIGHNNKVGNNVIMCGHTGVSGSCTIGDNAILAGNAGIADHINIGAQAVVAARSGVANDIPPRTQVFGAPAKERRIAWREQSALSKLPDLMKQIKIMEQRIADLEKDK